MSAPPLKKKGMSLYAELLGEDKSQSTGTTISSAPVRYDLQAAVGDGEGTATKKKDASLQFQPIRRPQKNKPKMTPSSTHKFSSSVTTAGTVTASSPDKQFASSTPSQHPSMPRSNFEDWVGGDNDDDIYFDMPKYERGGRKNKKKKKGQETRVWDWDDVYDPTLPNNYVDYKGSEEQVREIRDWKARLYHHKLNDRGKGGAVRGSQAEDTRKPVNRMFAPPQSFNFAPPPLDDGPRPPPPIDDDDDYYPPSKNLLESTPSYGPPTSFAQSSIADQNPTPPSAPNNGDATPEVAAMRAAAAAKIAEFKAKLAANKAASAALPPSRTTSDSPAQPAQPSPPAPPPPAEEPGNTISRAPVRYDQPLTASIPTDADDDVTMADADTSAQGQPNAPRSNRPGQKGFAERLLKKYGWEKGQGLGAQGEGITTAIFAKADKRKKLPDAQGGGWARATGKILGGKKRKIESTGDDDGTYGAMSEVVKLTGMLEGLDVDQEIMKEGQSLFQEIGEYMGQEFGSVERVFVWRKAVGGGDEVFVKFVSQLSALRAVNATDGMTFAGNAVRAKFWENRKFERGEYA